jgi:hypothetical protein
MESENPGSEGIRLELGGKTWVVPVLSVQLIRKYLPVLIDVASRFRIDTARVAEFVTEALKCNYPGITSEDVEQMLTLPGIVPAVIEIMKNSGLSWVEPGDQRPEAEPSDHLRENHEDHREFLLDCILEVAPKLGWKPFSREEAGRIFDARGHWMTLEDASRAEEEAAAAGADPYLGASAVVTMYRMEAERLKTLLTGGPIPEALLEFDAEIQKISEAAKVPPGRVMVFFYAYYEYLLSLADRAEKVLRKIRGGEIEGPEE